MASSREIDSALDPATIQGMQVIQGALTAGVVLFAAATYFRATLLLGGGDSSPFSGTLFLANVGALAIGFLLGSALYRTRMSGATGAVASRLEALKTATLVRLALLEGPALFGVAVCFLATKTGPPSDPAVWINLISPAAFVLFSWATFPNRQRVEALLADRTG